MPTISLTRRQLKVRESALVACPHEVSSPPEILSDLNIFHRWQRCPFEYVLVCHVVHPGYPHERTQMSHHEGMQLFHLSSVHCSGHGSVSEGGQHDCTVYLAFNSLGHMVVVS